MHLLRALGGDEEDEPELAALAGDADGVLRRQTGERVLGEGRAHVVRLVDHDQHGLAGGPPPPERGEQRLRRDRLLLPRCERAEVGHDAARPAGLNEVFERSGVVPGPDLPAVDAEVPGAHPERVHGVGRGAHLVDDLPHRPRLGRDGALERLGERRVLLAVADWVQAKHGRLLGRVEVSEADVEPVGARISCTTHLDGRGRGRVLRIDVTPDAVAQLGEADEVRVRVEDHDPERRLDQQPLEDRPERVRLPGAGLPAEERVPVERPRVERERHALGERQRPDLERSSRRPSCIQPPRDLLRRRDAGRGLAERRFRALEHAPFDACGVPPPLHQLHARHVGEPFP